MAILEFEFKATGLSGLTNNLNNLQNQLNNINRNSSININAGNSSRNLNVASDSILGLRARLNELLRTYGSLTEAQRNSASVTNNLVPEINRLREAVTQANREYDNLRRGTGRDIPSDSITGMRQRLNDLRRTYDGLSESQRNSGRVQNNLVTEINRLNQAVSQAEQSTGRFQRNVGNYQQRMIGANGVTMEFNRVIQDAPFGMMGIGNNLQQLASNWGDYTRQAREAATANGTTVTTMGLVRGAIGGILSPINLLTLGISVATSAWTFYSMNTKTAKEETKDINNQFTTQLGKLTNVISLTQKSALTERDKAIAVGLYNKELGDTLGKVKTYSELEKTLIKNGSNYVKYLSLKSQAEATYQISLKQTAQMMTNIMSLESKGRSTGFSGWVSKASDTIDELVYGEGSQGKTKITSAEAMRIAQLPTDKDFYIAIRGMGDALKKGLKDVRKDWKKSIQSSNLGGDLTQEFNKIADGLNLKMPDLNLDKSVSSSNSSLKDQRDYLLEIRGILESSQSRIDSSGDITSWDKEAVKIKSYYDKQELALDKMLVSAEKAYKKDSAKRIEIETAIASTRLASSSNLVIEMSKLDDKYFAEHKSKYNDLLAKYGEEIPETGLQKALRKVTEDFRTQKMALETDIKAFELDPKNIEKVRLLKEELQALIDLKGKADIDVKVKFATEHLADIDKMEKDIVDLINKPFSAKNKDNLQVQIDQRIKELGEIYDKLVEAMKLGYDGNGTGGFKISENDITKTKDEIGQQVRDNAQQNKDNKESIQSLKDYINIANEGFNSMFVNIRTNLDEMGNKASSVFFGIGESISSMLKQIANKNTAKFMENLTEGAEDFKGVMTNFNKMWKEDKNKVISAGFSMAGGMVSSLAGKSDVGGQALGGALSGAGAGTAILPGIGTAVGAAVGAVAGALSAAKNKKQEQLQQKQLEAQLKANALLERMNALTYASQIVGSRTEYGIVTGVNRNEFGEITLRVNGNDLVGSFDRTNTKKGR